MNSVSLGFWRGRRVFVTGHTGFKGAWLSLWLQQLGAEVTGYALPPDTQPSLFELAGVGNGMASVLGDVRDLERLASELAASRAEVVFHLAAQSLVRRGYADPVGTYSANVMGTVNLLESVRRTPSVRGVVVITSDKCYENRGEALAFVENDRLGGADPYSSSKACTELITDAYRTSFFNDRVSIASVRAGNVIGGGDWADDRLVPDAMRAFAAGRRLELRNPGAVRPWQHVTDPLHGYLMLAGQLHGGEADYAQAWNFGPEPAGVRTVESVVRRLADMWGANALWITDEREQPHEAAHLALDCGKARTRLGWTPRVALDLALDWTVEWYRQHAAGADMRALTLRQIERYVSMGAVSAAA